MSEVVLFWMSLSILLPIGIGMVRIKHLSHKYLPLLILLGIGLLHETVSYFFLQDGNTATTNVYYLIEILLYCWLFRRTGHTLRNKVLYYTILGLMITAWVIDNLVLNSIGEINPAFQIAYSLALILLAVDEMNWLIVNEHGEIITNPMFIICISIIIFFSYKALVEIFYHYAPDNAIKSNIFGVESFMNVGFNLLLSAALLCVPRKIGFIRQSL